MQAPNTEGWIDPDSKAKVKKPKKNIDFTLHSLWGMGAVPVIQPEIFTASGVCLSYTSQCFAFTTPHNQGLIPAHVLHIGQPESCKSRTWSSTFCALDKAVLSMRSCALM